MSHPNPLEQFLDRALFNAYPITGYKDLQDSMRNSIIKDLQDQGTLTIFNQIAILGPKERVKRSAGWHTVLSTEQAGSTHHIASCGYQRCYDVLVFNLNYHDPVTLGINDMKLVRKILNQPRATDP